MVLDGVVDANEPGVRFASDVPPLRDPEVPLVVSLGMDDPLLGSSEGDGSCSGGEYRHSVLLILKTSANKGHCGSDPHPHAW